MASKKQPAQTAAPTLPPFFGERPPYSFCSVPRIIVQRAANGFLISDPSDYDNPRAQFVAADADQLSAVIASWAAATPAKKR